MTLLERLKAQARAAHAAEDPSLPARSRAPNGTTPVNLKVRLSAAHADELQRRATAQGVSVATVVREIFNGALR